MIPPAPIFGINGYRNQLQHCWLDTGYKKIKIYTYFNFLSSPIVNFFIGDYLHTSIVILVNFDKEMKIHLTGGINKDSFPFLSERALDYRQIMGKK